MKYQALLVLVFAMSQFGALAQEETADTKWHFLAEPYLMFPSMNGESGIRELPPINVDANSSDIFNSLDFGIMVNFEATTDRWALGSDFVYTKLTQDVESSALINSGEIELKQMIWELSGLYRLLPFLETGIGFRLNDISMAANINRNIVGGGSSQLVSAENSEFWIDPVLIAQFSKSLNDTWQLKLRGDVGGFGIGSDFTWQLQASAGYRFSKLFQTTLGYRIIGMDYDQGSGSSRFRYDLNTSGPLIKLGFNF
ncbi:hypothetical protein [Robiginitalea marina]|uniref:Outer membrane protein beta-barrel domain-containing protein n=1 Tax=Robiginitalea marina TaxID=2954105 RepID=A0ABT1ATS8_9FLAO|nr:hypothetical protein [Robiginitalea marina]MCO5723236.1 hypothetical protein [Robiginitalea marina]